MGSQIGKVGRFSSSLLVRYGFTIKFGALGDLMDWCVSAGWEVWQGTISRRLPLVLGGGGGG